MPKKNSSKSTDSVTCRAKRGGAHTSHTRQQHQSEGRHFAPCRTTPRRDLLFAWCRRRNGRFSSWVFFFSFVHSFIFLQFWQPRAWHVLGRWCMTELDSQASHFFNHTYPVQCVNCMNRRDSSYIVCVPVDRRVFGTFWCSCVTSRGFLLVPTNPLKKKKTTLSLFASAFSKVYFPHMVLRPITCCQLHSVSLLTS